MPQLNHRFDKLILLSALVAFATMSGCEQLPTAKTDTTSVPLLKIGFELPSGWELDPTVATTGLDPAKGGLLMRLQPRDRIAGSPRLEIRLDPLRVKPISLEAFVEANIDHMKKIESQGGTKTVRLDRNATTLLDSPAFRVEHEYTLGDGIAQLSVTQTSWFTEVDGRATVFTVSGRTELTTPHLEKVESALKSLAPLAEQS